MAETVDFLLVVVLLLNLLMLGTSRVRTAIRAAGGQGFSLGVAFLVMHGQGGIWPIALSIATIAIKAAVIPRILESALRSQSIKREVEPYVSFTTSLLLGGGATGLAVLFAETLPVGQSEMATLLVPASLSTVLTGFVVLTTRRKALMQIVGYLTLENGIFIFGLMLAHAMPFLVEAGVLLDVLVGVFVMGIVVENISDDFGRLGGPSDCDLGMDRDVLSRGAK